MIKGENTMEQTIEYQEVKGLRVYAKKFPGRLDIAITKAIDDCITEGVLKDFLIERKSEVLEMVLYSFDKELYEKDLKQIAFEEGEQVGLEKGIEKGEHNKLIALVQKKLQRGDSVEKIADDLMESNETITGIIDILNK